MFDRHGFIRDRQIGKYRSLGLCHDRDVLIRDVLVAPDEIVRGDRGLTRAAIATGAIFVVAGLVKFVFHHWELHAFQSFGLPWPWALEIVAGVVETLGGVLLLMRRLIAPVASVLATTMIVAIISSGIGQGDVIPSLTLAPALLVVMLYLLARTLTLRLQPRVAE
jgi:uncharacterized membrane protein YphA (DoxX/SURF4 family)